MSRRFKTFILLCFLVGAAHIHAQLPIEKTLLFIGSYTDGAPAAGIHIYDFNTQTGELKKLAEAEGLVNPSFLAVSPNGQNLYACTHTKSERDGSISSFKIDTVSGQITFMNEHSAGGRNPVHVSVHPSGRYVSSASYTDAGVAFYKTNEDGSIQTRLQLLEFIDHSVVVGRQEEAHIHSSFYSGDGRFLFAPDLGADKIRAFSVEGHNDNLRLLINDPYTVNTVAASGPRHFAFHPSQKFAYCAEELSGRVAAYTYKDGLLTLIDRYFSYSQEFESYSSADIHLSKDGKFLYVSNRLTEENTVTIFAVHPENGSLKLVGHQSTLGDHPRNFTIDPTDQFLLVANMHSNTVVVFERNPQTGLLLPTGEEIKMSSPSCLQMYTYGQ